MSVLCMAALGREIRAIEKEILKARGLEREALEYRLADRGSTLSLMIANFGVKKMSVGTSRLEAPE
jgi:hypothetical protein